MGVRFFVSQESLDLLTDAGVADLKADTLEVSPRGLRARVEPAVYVVTEVEGKGDPHELVGKVKTAEAIASMRGDHYRESLLVGETAYEVIEGYLGEADEGWVWPDGGRSRGAGAPIEQVASEDRRTRPALTRPAPPRPIPVDDRAARTPLPRPAPAARGKDVPPPPSGGTGQTKGKEETGLTQVRQAMEYVILDVVKDRRGRK